MSEMTPMPMMGASASAWPNDVGFDDSYLAGPSTTGYEADNEPRQLGDMASAGMDTIDRMHATENEMSTNPLDPPLDAKDTEEPSTASTKYFELDFQKGTAEVQKKKRAPEQIFSDVEDIDSHGDDDVTENNPDGQTMTESELKHWEDESEKQSPEPSSNATGPPLPPPSLTSLPPPSLASLPPRSPVRRRVPTDQTASESLAGYSAGVSEGYTHRHTYSDASSVYLPPTANFSQARRLSPQQSTLHYTPPTGIARTPSTESKLPQLSVAEKSTVMAPKNPTRQKKCKLREGRFSVDDGSTRRFVYVPSKFNFRTKEGFESIIQALGLSKPDLAFQVGDCFSVVPNSNQHEIQAYYQDLRPSNYEGSPQKWMEREDLKFAHPGRDYFDILTRHNRVRSILDAIATACTTATAPVFVLNAPHRGNEIAEFALEAAQEKNIASLGLFHDGDFTCVSASHDENEEADAAELQRVDMELFLERGFEVPWDRYWSKRRQQVPKDLFQEKDFLTDLNDEPNESMQIHCQRSPSEAAFRETYRFNVIKNGLADSCSHLLVFESKEAKSEFYKIYTSLNNAGIIIAGSNVWALEKAFECLQQCRPMFILEHTGATSNAVAELVRFGAKIEDFRNAGARLAQPKYVDPLAVDSYIHAHFPPYDRRTELAMDDNIWEYARVIAHNFLGSAPHFSWRSNSIIDVASYVDVNGIQDDVSRVINSLSEVPPEIGGPVKEFEALSKAKSMMDELARTKTRYRIGSVVLQVLIRMMILIAVAFGISLGVAVDKNDNNGAYNALRVFVILLPLIAGILITLEATIRPSLKYALLLLAEKRIESEMYRFRTMTGIYRRNAGESRDAARGTRNRSMFMEQCEEIVESCFESDVGGSLFSMTTRQEEISRMFDQSGNSSRQVSYPRNKKAVQKITTSSGREEGWSNEKLRVSRWLRLNRPDAASPTNAEYDPEMGKSQAKSLGASACYAPVSTSTLERVFVSADGYVEKRIVEQSVAMYGDAPWMATFRLYIKFAVIMLTASSSALASFEKPEWVPLPLAIAAVLEFAKDYMQLDTRVPTINGAAGELIKVWLWWSGLSIAQTRLASNKDELVDRSERAILAQYENFAGSVVSALRSRRGTEEGPNEVESVLSSPQVDHERKRFQQLTTDRKKFQGEASV